MNLKSSLLSAVFVLFFFALFAQPADEDNGGSKFYIKAYGGYGLLNPGSYKLISTTNVSTQGAFTTSTSGLGAGLRFGGGIGVIASDFLNIGVDVDYLSASTLNAASHDMDNSVTPATNGVSMVRLNYTSIAVIPHVIFKAISKPDYLIYTKVGVLLNLPMDLKKSRLDSLVPDGDANNYKEVFNGTYKFGLSAGLNVALGVQYRITDNIRAFGEIFGHFISLVPTQYDEQAVTTGTVSQTQSNHITYIKNGKMSYTSNPDNSVTTSVQPQEGNRFNMNTLGINIGITYRF